MSMKPILNLSIIHLEPISVFRLGCLLSRHWQKVAVEHQYPRSLTGLEHSLLMDAELFIKYMQGQMAQKSRGQAWDEARQVFTRLLDAGWAFFGHASGGDLTILIKKDHNSSGPPALSAVTAAENCSRIQN